MATVEFITKRIEGTETKIAKLEKKLERITAAKDSNWEKNPYYYSEYDLTSTERELNSTKQLLTKYQNELKTTIEKDNSRNVKAIIDFLEMWKDRVYKSYSEDFDKYYAMVAERIDYYNNVYRKDLYPSDEVKAEYERLRKRCFNALDGYYERRVYNNHFGRSWEQEIKVKDGELEHIKPYIRKGNKEDAQKYLKKDLEQEAKLKYDYIIERTNKIVGQITDASFLRVGENGELNGFIIGADGKASVTTIGAGGYNIQRFHYRVLVNEMR